MDTPSTKDYVDAKVETIAAEVHQYYAMTEARLAEMEARVVNRLAEMETRLLRGQAEILKWCVGVVFAGMTINISVSAYLYSSTQSQIASLQTQVSATQVQMQELIREVRASRVPPSK